MKVLKEGKWHLPWSAEAVCKACQATVLVEEGDVEPTFGEFNAFYWRCPACDVCNEISEAAIHPRVKCEVEKRRQYSSSDDW